MGLPFWEMPDQLSVGGVSYPIDTDFRVGIRIRQMFWEPYYQTRQMLLIDGIRRLLFFGADVGVGQETELLCAVLWYLMDGRLSEEGILRRLSGEDTYAAGAISASGADTVFSYLWDMPAVYASFMSVYRMDLLTADMHLWQFDALFDALDADCAVRRISALRAMSVGEVCEEMRPQLAAEKLAVRIPDREELYRAALARAGHCSFARSETVARPDDSRTADSPPPLPHGCVSADALQPNFDPIKEEQHHANT